MKIERISNIDWLESSVRERRPWNLLLLESSWQPKRFLFYIGIAGRKGEGLKMGENGNCFCLTIYFWGKEEVECLSESA